MPKNTVIPSPVHLAEMLGFKLDDPINLENKRHSGTCICGTKGSLSYDSLRKRKFCRNLYCNYYQPAKRLDEVEMKIIIEERKCNLIDIKGKGVNTSITFICECGFKQNCKWVQFYKDKWCVYFKCTHYKRNRNLTTEVVKRWFEIEDYTVPKNFEYNSEHGFYYRHKYTLLCPKNHEFHCSTQMWVGGSRCMLCNGNGRSFGYYELKDFYEKYGCKLLLKESEYTGNNTIHNIPYQCPKGHIIKNLSKNQVNVRLNQQLGICSMCNKHDLQEVWNVQHHMQIPEIISKQQNTDKRGKKYTFPSGKEIVVQSTCEMKCLDILLTELKENDILTDIEDKPEIWYNNPTKGRKCRYFTDFYIPKLNLAIEVKSIYWFERKRDVNLAKLRATLDKGYRLKLYIYDEKGLNSIHEYFPNKKLVNLSL